MVVKRQEKEAVVARTCNSILLKAKAGLLHVQVHSGIHNEFQASLRPCLEKKKRINKLLIFLKNYPLHTHTNGLKLGHEPMSESLMPSL